LGNIVNDDLYQNNKQTSFIVDIVNIFLLFTDTDFREWA